MKQAGAATIGVAYTALAAATSNNTNANVHSHPGLYGSGEMVLWSATFKRMACLHTPGQTSKWHPALRHNNETKEAERGQGQGKRQERRFRVKQGEVKGKVKRETAESEAKRDNSERERERQCCQASGKRQ